MAILQAVFKCGTLIIHCALTVNSIIAMFRKFIRAFIKVRSFVLYSYRFYKLPFGSIIDKPDLLFQPKAISIGDNVYIRKGSRLEAAGLWDGGSPKITIGNRTSIHLYFHCGAAESVIIGQDVLIAGRVYISDHDHEYDHPLLPASKSGLRVAPVIIEDGVWIGEGAVILKGVTVGKRAVIGANAVVTKNVPAYTVVGGIPARVIKKLNI
jgi:acetyltransferase-like isoleucine patch superfamily enzyme